MSFVYCKADKLAAARTLLVHFGNFFQAHLHFICFSMYPQHFFRIHERLMRHHFSIPLQILIRLYEYKELICIAPTHYQTTHFIVCFDLASVHHQHNGALTQTLQLLTVHTFVGDGRNPSCFKTQNVN